MTEPRAASAPRLVGRDRALTLARDLLLSAGADVDIVGPRRSGRSSAADAITAFASDAHRTAVRLNGVRSLSTTPLAALHAAGLGDNTGLERRTPSPLQNAIDALTAAVARTDAVIVVDDADLLDDASTGAVDAVRRATQVPLLRTRTRRPRAAESGYVVELTPLSYDQLAAVVGERLDGPVDATTMSRLYAMSGGNVGVAVSMIRLAAVEGTLSRRAGIWTAERDLWTPSLHGLVIDLLAGFTPAELAALEAVAVDAHDDAAAVRQSLRERDSDSDSAASLNALEATGVVKTVDHGGRRRIVLEPPLLSEHFRRAGEAPTADDALVARLVHEETAANRAAARAEWRRSPTPRSALALARALMAPAGLNPGAAAELDTVLTAASGHTEDPLALVELAELRARRALGTGVDLATTAAALHTAVSELGHPYSHAADATAALLAVEVGAAPGTEVEQPGDDRELPTAVRSRRLLAAQAVALQRGRFADALDFHERMRSLPDAEIPPLADALHGLALLGCGRSAESATWAARGSAAARERLDVDALRAHSLVAGLGHLVSGRTEAASEAIATATALGAPPFPGSAAELGLRTLAAIVAARRGDPAGAERVRDELAVRPDASSPAGRAAFDWIDAQLAAVRGRPDEAVARLRRLAAGFRSTRQEAAAAFALLTALEHSTDESGLDEARSLLAGQQSELFDAQLAQLVARAEHDHDAQRALASRLAAVGLERSTAGGHDRTGFFTTPVSLTEREREIVRFVADGLVYREIAARLHLSARTVEGIAARIIRKLGLRDRRELAELARSGAL
ncbi:helix-turn-helix transcriptional regulator [Leifsonia shinshuensis]|uniref:helix-turn-helix domain-containing protein n=1 Tax=Leifsonia shinshuensis TaxID=150026 RepID=UPI001F513EDB|nr:helix-turn-helix transcriptional regulator [Leifsonia shinshuensis]MCI0159227.1 helix-turn-helix transcriptional regulator [Leifsonia shinshuensis]